MLEHGVVRCDGGCEVDARTWGCEVRDGAGTWRGVRCEVDAGTSLRSH